MDLKTETSNQRKFTNFEETKRINCGEKKISKGGWYLSGLTSAEELY